MNVALIILLLLFFLFGTAILTTVSSAFRRLHKRESKRQIHSLGSLFFYRKVHRYFFPNHEFEGIFFVTVCAQNITRFGFGAFSFFLIWNLALIPSFASDDTIAWIYFVVAILILLFCSFIFGEFLPRYFGNRYPEVALKVCSPFASIFMLATFPLAALFIKLTRPLWYAVYFDYLNEPQAQAKQEIIEMIQDSDMDMKLDPVDKKIFGSIMGFRERIAREIMVPRVNVFSLPADTSIKDAARLLDKEGYSRVPVYRNTVDNIIGVLMHKDILRKYMQDEFQGGNSHLLDAPIDTIVKNILYTPETKKISHLLQEFRKRQMHLAIVVDEYGGTEGIVTIEDILEEIVGEIADEYDEEAEPFVVESDGSWLADAKMSIIDVEEELGLKIPQEGDFDTIGGYIYHRAGTIPSKGFAIYHDDFKIEVVKSNERSIEKVRITPLREMSDE